MENKASSLKKLSLWQVTIIGIAYMTPMTVFDTFGIVSGITNGHVPLAYLLALGAMLLTAWSYARFSQNSEKSGSAEPYRVCRRLNILRDYSDEKTNLYPRNQRKSGSITN